MLRFTSGVVIGIYVAQNYPTPNITLVVNGLVDEIHKKWNEYPQNTPSPLNQKKE